jgi:ATP-dependent exoDNAse (exonuclease V) beta subunit
MKIEKQDIVDLLHLSEEQERVLDLQTTSIVRAGAGAGKTTTLVAALLYDLLCREIAPEKIAVATFTRSAAAGLRSRLEESLWKIFSTDHAPDLSALWLGTIDSLALRYLRMFSLRNGMDPGVVPARKRDLLALARSAFDEVLPGRDSLIRAFSGEDNLYREFLAFQLHLESKGEEHFSVFAKARGESEKTALLLEELALSGVGEKSYEMIQDDINCISLGQPERMKKETKWNIRKESDLFLRVQEARNEWRKRELDHKLLPLKEEAEVVFADWQEKYSEMREEYGCFSYTDIIRRALLIASPRFARIYIDEAQDTSVLQRELIGSLSCGETIFIGDKNQSIYHFRGADTDLWEEETKDLPEVLLRDNYRSGKKILSFVEDACKPLLGEDLLRMRGKREGGEVSILLGERKEDEKPALSEARSTLPRVLQKIKEKGYGYSDVAILLPGNEDINAYYKVLRELKIPALALRAKGLLQEEECLDMKAYLSFLANPEDERALLRVLSSPFFSLEKEELLLLSQKKEGDAKRGVEQPLFMYLAEEKRKSLKEDLAKRGREKPSLILRLAIQKYSYDLALELLDATGVMRDNIEGFLGIIEEIEEDGSDFSSVMDALKREEEANDDGQDKELPQGREAVRLLTIHRAKGDEFPVVISGRNSRRKKYASNRLITHEGELGISLKDGLRDSVADAALQEESRLLQEEGNRLFYVALTRAENELFVLASPERKGGKIGSPLFDTGILQSSWEIEEVARENDEMTSDEITLQEDEQISKGQYLFLDARLADNISWSRLASWDECSLRRYLEMNSFKGQDADGGEGEGKRILGEEIHSRLAKDIQNGKLDPTKYPPQAKAMIESLQASNILEEIFSFDDIATEVPFTFSLEGLPLRGRIDLLCLSGSDALVLDWKSGEDDHFDKAYDLQRKIYALAVLLRPDIESVRSVTYYLRKSQAKEEIYSDKEDLTKDVSALVHDILTKEIAPASRTEKPFCARCPGLTQICPVANSKQSI